MLYKYQGDGVKSSICEFTMGGMGNKTADDLIEVESNKYSDISNDMQILGGTHGHFNMV